MGNEETSQVLLALSGGGYRAMLFHVGALWRLNELGELNRCTHVSSVSGGSIVAGVLAANWEQLDFDHRGVARAYRERIAEPLIRLAGYHLDVPAVLVGLIPIPYLSAARVLEFSYRWLLFGNKKLTDIPSSPEFIFNATNVQTGALWSFRKEAMGDINVGVRKSDVPLARAVAASNAFPPFLAPVRMRFPEDGWEPYPQVYGSMKAYDDLAIRSRSIPHEHSKKYRKRVVLADGGIADNLGIVALWRSEGDLYISDGGGLTKVQARPWRNWLGQLIRTVALIHDQPSQLRSLTAISRFADYDERGQEKESRIQRGDGAYWRMHLPLVRHRDVILPELHEEEITRLATIRTALWALSKLKRQQLVNWGYVAANRSLPYVGRLWRKGSSENPSRAATIFEKHSLPFPEAGFGPVSAKLSRSSIARRFVRPRFRSFLPRSGSSN